jgi:hypothetical protein
MTGSPGVRLLAAVVAFGAGAGALLVALTLAQSVIG